jgi:hypothetical protein
VNMEHYWWNDTGKGKPVVLVEMPVPMSLPPWIPHVLSWYQARAFSFLILITFAAALPVDMKPFVCFTGPHVAQTVLMCTKKLLETSVLTWICSCIHFLFFLVHYFFYFRALVCIFCVNMCRTSFQFCNFNTSDPADVSVYTVSVYPFTARLCRCLSTNIGTSLF